MNRNAVRTSHGIHVNPTAVNTLKAFLVLGFIYIGAEFFGLVAFQIQFFDTWPLLGQIAWAAAMHGTLPERLGLGVIVMAMLYGLSLLFERR